MGSRTRNHIIEDESRTQFKLILPSEWVLRDKSNDYGIDCEVEIFDKGGNPTGNVFWVQLKATDSKIKQTQQSFRLKTSKLKQLISYPIPVLLARYASAENFFYVNWANKIGLLNSNHFNNTVNVEFQDYDIWGKNTPFLIKNYIDNVNEVRKGNFRLPIKCFTESSVVDLNISSVITLRSFLSKYNSLLNISRNKNEALLFVYLSNNRLLISLMDQYGASFEIDEKDTQNFNAEKISKLVLIGLLIIFAQQRKHDLFKIVLEEGDLKDSIKELPEILNDLAPHLLSGDDLQNNLSFIFECLDESEDMDLEIVINLQLLFLRESANATKREAILFFLERKLQRSEKIGSNKFIATHLYNLGQFHRGIGDLSKALYYYNQARKKYEFYLKMDYFLKELGGLLFDSKKYKMSCFFYRKAWEKDNSNPLIHAAYGDALLFNGMYLAAKEKYDYFLLNANDDFDKHEWHLKFACISTLLENHYPIEQKRKELEALELASPENLKPGELFCEKIEKAIKLDMLCSLAWYNAGQDDVENGKLLNGFIAFLMCGLINRWDIHSWLNATIIGFQIEEASKLVYHVINTAYFYCGEEYLEKLTQHINESSLTPMPKLIELIDSLIENPKQRTKELRIVGDDGDFKVVILED